jgi:transmembrane sensor
MVARSKRIHQEATEWIAKRELGELTPEERAQLETWLNADPRHRGAFVRADAARLTAERIAALAGGSTPEVHRSSAWLRPAFAAAAVGVALLGTLIWVSPWLREDHYLSGVGEIRSVALEDGSDMVLDTASDAVVHFDTAARRINLKEGEALFKVAKNPTRPFLVHAGDVTVRAIGTLFSVQNNAAGVAVTVAEGVVEVDRNDGRETQLLTADQTALITKERPLAVRVQSTDETERQLTWHTGRLEFDGQSLSAAVAQLNRYSRRQIIVTDPQLAGRPVVGSFRSTDLESFARIAASALGARVEIRGMVILLEPVDSP